MEKDVYIKLLERINSIQEMRLNDLSSRDIFEKLLDVLLEVTSSEYGFIGEVLHNETQPYLRTQAISNIAWNKETMDYFNKFYRTGLEFYNLETLFGVTLKTGKPVISNDPPNDPRGAGIPMGHPALKTYLGAPLDVNGKMIGMVGIANREGGYDDSMVEFLKPLLHTCASLIQSKTMIDDKDGYKNKFNELSEKLDHQINYLKGKLHL